MKKALTLLGLVPFMALAQSETGIGSLVGIIITFLIALVVFLVIRGLMLWYWKVDKIVNNLEAQNRTLEAILRKMEEQKTDTNQPTI